MRKQIVVCDGCGKRVDEGDAVLVRVDFRKAGKIVQGELCEPCAGNIPGTPSGRRGRRPNAKKAGD